jgi:hypothetical protein
MKAINYISLTLIIAAFTVASCSKMAPLNRKDDKGSVQVCGTDFHNQPDVNVVEPSAIFINNGNDETGGSGITDPDHDSDHDRDKKKPK